MTATPTDWRGTPITVGALVIYGAPVGRSIALVEATVEGFTKTGRVNVRILRRAHGGSWSEKEVVHVGADRLVVVESLPPSDVPLTSDAIAARKAEQDERQRVRDTHYFPEPYQEEADGEPLFRGWRPHIWIHPPCSKCGAENTYRVKECPCPS